MSEVFEQHFSNTIFTSLCKTDVVTELTDHLFTELTEPSSSNSESYASIQKDAITSALQLGATLSGNEDLTREDLVEHIRKNIQNVTNDYVKAYLHTESVQSTFQVLTPLSSLSS